MTKPTQKRFFRRFLKVTFLSSPNKVSTGPNLYVHFCVCWSVYFWSFLRLLIGWTYLLLWKEELLSGCVWVWFYSYSYKTLIQLMLSWCCVEVMVGVLTISLFMCQLLYFGFHKTLFSAGCGTRCSSPGFSEGWRVNSFIIFMFW